MTFSGKQNTQVKKLQAPHTCCNRKGRPLINKNVSKKCFCVCCSEVKKLNSDLNRHVVLSGTPEHGTPEHRNITEHSGTPEKPGTPQKNQEHPQKTRNTRKKTRNTPKKPGTPQKTWNTSPLQKKRNRNLKKQMARQYVTARVSFSKLPPLIADKII